MNLLLKANTELEYIENAINVNHIVAFITLRTI